jgi:hypothetical protein
VLEWRCELAPADAPAFGQSRRGKIQPDQNPATGSIEVERTIDSNRNFSPGKHFVDRGGCSIGQVEKF